MGELITPELLLTLAGLFHFALLPVSLSVPKVLDWKRELALLSPLTRQIVWVHGAFIFALIAAFGVLTLIGREAMVAGTGLGPALAATIGLFWLARVGVQLLVFHPKHWPKGVWVTLGRHALTALFTFWAMVYLIVAASSVYKM